MERRTRLARAGLASFALAAVVGGCAALFPSAYPPSVVNASADAVLVRAVMGDGSGTWLMAPGESFVPDLQFGVYRVEVIDPGTCQVVAAAETDPTVPVTLRLSSPVDGDGWSIERLPGDAGAAPVPRPESFACAS
jgi:hypothetical protein